ncbi:MarR family winged helix-turn-helix transcriptional regulator [Microbacterium sp. KR10-403]|uniref:MarR family winged helix-turn-helix transcriptional regulator n=1 Tax=Microbacterium sp. KR10-403 TaxID=3158581 RepID=UPI0032E3FE41
MVAAVKTRSEGERMIDATDERRIDAVQFEAMAEEAVDRFVPEADFGAMAVIFNMVRLSGRVVADLEKTVHRPAGLTWASWRVMFALWVAGDLEPRVLAHLSGVSRASISATLNTLERDGHIVRSRSDSDRRVVTVSITDKARATIAEVVVRQSAREKTWASVLSADEQKSFVRALRKMLAFHVPPVGSTGQPHGTNEEPE